MRQSRLYDYSWAKRWTHLPGRCYLLELPTAIRRQIYDELELTDLQLINLNDWTQHNKRNLEPEEDVEPWLERDRRQERREAGVGTLPINLLLVCRTIYNETLPLLYAAHRFTISANGFGGLDTLLNVNAVALSALRKVTVVFHEGPWTSSCCPTSFDPASSWTRAQLRDYRTPLRLKMRTERKWLVQWQTLCARLAVNLPSKTLDLALIADCADLVTAEQIIKPLLRLPTLQNCRIRLGTQRDLKLQHLAHATVLKLTNRKPTSEQHFRFLDLPQEIQVQILEYTSLVNYWGFEWAPNRSFGPPACKSGCYSNVECCDCLDDNHWFRICPNRCFCMQRHAASASGCDCESSRLTYLLVSKDFSKLAQYIWSSRNRFLLVPSDCRYNPKVICDSWDDISLYAFLSKLNPSQVSYLTSLTVLVRPPDCFYLLPEHIGWSAWLAAVDRLATMASLPALQLDIYMHDVICVNRPWGSQVDEYDAAMLKMYWRIVKPLRALQGLRAFSIHLGWPGPRGPAYAGPRHESQMEQYVMGEGYDAYAHGKVLVEEYRESETYPERSFIHAIYGWICYDNGC